MQVENGIITLADGVSITFLQIGYLLVFDVVFGIIGEEIAKAKGRSRPLWLILCSLFPPLIIMLLTMESKPRKSAAAPAAAKPRRQPTPEAESESA